MKIMENKNTINKIKFLAMPKQNGTKNPKKTFIIKKEVKIK